MKNKMELHFGYEEKKTRIADKAFFTSIVAGLILTAIATIHIASNIGLKWGLIVGVLCTAFIVGSYVAVRFCDKTKRGRR